MSQCFIDVDIDGGSELHSVRTPIAKKEHKCAECNGLIKIGDKYEYIFMISDGSPYVHKTCSVCQEIRDALFCTWCYGMIWEDLWELERYGDGIPMCAFNGFSPEAIEGLSAFFEEVNESEGDY